MSNTGRCYHLVTPPSHKSSHQHVGVHRNSGCWVVEHITGYTLYCNQPVFQRVTLVICSLSVLWPCNTEGILMSASLWTSPVLHIQLLQSETVWKFTLSCQLWMIQSWEMACSPFVRVLCFFNSWTRNIFFLRSVPLCSVTAVMESCNIYNFMPSFLVL